MRPVLVQPEDRRSAAGLGPRHRQLHPVLDGGILGLAGAPNVSLVQSVPQKHGARLDVHDAHGAILLGLESGGVGAVLLRLLRHEAHVGAGPHRLGVKGAVLLAELHALAENTGVGAVRDGGLEVLLRVIGIPHLPTSADGRWHGVVDDDIAGHVEVSDALVGIHHGHARLGLVGGLQVRLDRLTLSIRQCRNLLVQVAQPVVGVHTQLFEGVSILCEDVLEEGLHAVPEHDGVRHLHHGSLEMQ
mmetsp:Transcript_20944/g.49751  ORF Transcript_20944/g.49751 Transcript_20944/m.49751 type:complete len:245 (+) Transcript_20944:845-1579(+)